MFFGADRGSGTVQADSEPLLYLVPEAVRTFIRIFKVFPFRYGKDAFDYIQQTHQMAFTDNPNQIYL